MTVCVLLWLIFLLKCGAGGIFSDADKHSIDENKQMNRTSGELVSVLESPF